MKSLKFKIHWSFIVLGLLMLFLGNVSNFLLCLLCAILHEMGHSYVGKKLGYKLNIITLMPYGAMLSGSNAPFSESDEIKIAVAGPFVNAVLIIISLLFGRALPLLHNLIYNFAIANAYTLCFNILPVYPLDGGRIFLAILSKYNSRVKAYKITKIVGLIITGLVFLLFFISFIYNLNYMLGINALFMLIGLLENDTDIYYKKLNSFEKFRFSFGKTIKLNDNDTIFSAYKSIIENKAKNIMIESNNTKKILSRNDITSKILSLPINTKLKELDENVNKFIR